MSGTVALIGAVAMGPGSGAIGVGSGAGGEDQAALMKYFAGQRPPG
jgi:hypothetical protein